MIFDPKTNKFPYPEYTDKHYLVVKQDDGTIFDARYPYVDDSFKFRFKRFWIRVLIVLVVFLTARVRMGLRIKGRKNLRKYKSVIKNGVISICNHVHMWDYIGIMSGVKIRWPYLLAWQKNISGELGGLIRGVGGIPIPENNLGGTAAYFNALKKLLDSGHWLHIYPEGSMWEYYQPIRPFKRGPAYLSIKLNKPIIPLAYSYRKPGWIRRKIFNQIALFTLHIGEPIYPNIQLDDNDIEIDLTKRCHEAVCKLAGIEPSENLYKPVFNNDKRVDYYTDTYGVGYKGSH